MVSFFSISLFFSLCLSIVIRCTKQKSKKRFIEGSSIEWNGNKVIWKRKSNIFIDKSNDRHDGTLICKIKLRQTQFYDFTESILTNRNCQRANAFYRIEYVIFFFFLKNKYKSIQLLYLRKKKNKRGNRIDAKIRLCNKLMYNKHRFSFGHID